MKNRLPHMLLTLLLLPAWAVAEVTVGVQTLTVPVAHHDAPLQGVIWYPAQAGSGTATHIGANPVFQGVAAQENAEPAQGRRPVVMLSHGLGGHIYSLSWLARGLAERGAIVFGVNHPNSSFMSFDMRAGLRHGTRARDLSATLDRLLTHRDWQQRLDPARVYAAGFSYGGWTALSLGGLRGHLAGYRQHCQQSETSSHCADIARAGVDLAELDAAHWDGDWRDARVRAVAAIDPGLLYGIEAAQTRHLLDDVLLIALGAGADRLPATDFSEAGSAFVTRVPQAQVLTLAPANHFTAFLTCRPEGAALLREENDDPVCTDPPGADRAGWHQVMIAAVAARFALN